MRRGTDVDEHRENRNARGDREHVRGSASIFNGVARQGYA